MRRRRKRCRYCSELFRPDPRVGKRQRACSERDCQNRRQAENREDWLRRHSGYFTGRGPEHRRYREEISSGERVPIRRPKPKQNPGTGEQSEQEEISTQIKTRQGVTSDLAICSEQEEISTQAKLVQTVATVLVSLLQASEQEQLGAKFSSWEDLARCLVGQSKRPPIPELAPLLEVGGHPTPAETVRTRERGRHERERQRNERTESAAT